MNLDKNSLLIYLNNKGISYVSHEHSPLFTVKESLEKRGKIIGAHSKNLFLKNKKNIFFLFSCLENTNIDLKKLSRSLQIGNISFAKEGALYELLGVNPGSVTPFGLLNDVENKVKFFLDIKFFSYESVNFHPLINTNTINLNVKDLFDLLLENKKDVNIIDFNEYSLIDRKEIYEQQ